MSNTHDTLRNCIARNVFKPAGLAYNLEVPFLIPNTSLRPADILVQPAIASPAAVMPRPTAYDVTVRSPFVSSVRNTAASKRAGAAEAAHKDKLSTLQRDLRDALHVPDNEPIPSLDWYFCPLAFDTLGAPSECTISVIEEHARKIALRSSKTYASAKLRIEQCLNYSVWSSTAEAVLSRMPSLAVALNHSQQV